MMQKGLVILVAVLGVLCCGHADINKRYTETATSKEESSSNGTSKSAVDIGSINKLLSLTHGLVYNNVTTEEPPQYSPIQEASYKVQNTVSQEATYAVQSTLSQEALQAALNARAAVLAKEIAYAGLEQVVEDARQALEDEFIQYKTAERSAVATREAAEAADKQISSLTETLKSANAAAERALNVAEEAANEFASQSSMVSEAQERLIAANEKWRAAQRDFEITKEAVDKASAAAKQAEENAKKAKIVADENLQGVDWRDRLDGLGVDSLGFDALSSNSFRHTF